MKFHSKEGGIRYGRIGRFSGTVSLLFFLLLFTSVDTGLSAASTKRSEKVKLLSLVHDLILEPVTL